ncbi:ATP-grasp domain-containing protein [Methylobacterium sp. J-068]|uniref:ATP-grasp domain-containing protein n=1 Tax=Methylobacterium sp. J-068 TaxID=2836649 RepID=UPI0028BD7DCA|nr:ATP-grasp domain-containing protein [Methylobacterium sp. J-068]
MHPLVLDLFGDADTRALAEGYRQAEGRFGLGLTGGILRDLGDLALHASDDPVGIVLGSGFEAAPGLMRAIAARFTLLGASPDCVGLLKDPLAFAELCRAHGVPHPAVTREPVADRTAWLLKRAGGSGGTHIRAATGGRAPLGAYFQARVPGRAVSLSFLADGAAIRVVGVTEQWGAPSPLRPFRYAGALERARHEPPCLAPPMLAAVTEGVARLAAATALRGLASADCLVDGPDWWLTEINPRPGATLDVLDRRPTPLLARHIAASLGHLSEPEASPEDAAATEICYAASGYAPMPPIDWPDFVRDRPKPGTTVARDAPLCTLFATGPDSAATRAMLRGRAAELRTLPALTEGHP